MKKEIHGETVTACKVARRLGIVYGKKAICPGCGKIEHVEALAFELQVIDGKIKEVNSPKADGVKWCPSCA